MKKIITLLSFGFLSLGVYAQGIEIYLLDTDVDISGTIVNIDGPESDMHQDFDVKNVSGSTLTLRIERIKILELAGTEDYLCWGANPLTGSCYSASLVSPENPFISPDASDMANDSIGWLSTHHSTLGFSGCAQYRYYVIDGSGTRLDSVDVKFCSTVSIEEEVAKISVSAFPNPTTGLLTVAVQKNSHQVKFVLYNVLGESVLAANLTEGQNLLNLEKLPNGVYFYSILNDGNVIETKKLIIRH